jgi:hypothetical protein
VHFLSLLDLSYVSGKEETNSFRTKNNKSILSLDESLNKQKKIFRECLTGAIEHSDSSTVGCPYKDEKYSCDMTVLEREIKAVS